MQTYTIAIDESQREMIATAMLAFDGSKHFNADDYTSLMTLFCDLAKTESANPKAIHGFCY